MFRTIERSEDWAITLFQSAMQQTNYYPFGMTLQQQNFGGQHIQPNRLLYNSKELNDDELAGSRLDWYDYGARMYDAAISRFTTIDPLSDSYSYQSPFVYAVNNPIMFIDWMGMGPKNPPTGTTQIYFKFSGSFGPQIGFNIGDVLSGTLRAANVVGETKLGLTISPEGKIGLLVEQDSKNVNYEMEGSIPVVGGKSKSSEYGSDEHPIFSVERTETQKGFVKETEIESKEKVMHTESTSYEVGVGVNVAIVGVAVGFGFEYVVDAKTQTKPENQEDKNK